MRRTLANLQWERIRANPTLHPNALLADEAAGDFPWHDHSHSPKSSQVFCISAFGTLRQIRQRHRIIHSLLVPIFPAAQTKSPKPRRWDIRLEVEEASLLGELGVSQPTSIDAMLISSREVICIESKFVVDAAAGLGGCGQVHTKKGDPPRCAGFHGPGSDLKTRTRAWCRLETWEGRRSPRLYWLLGRQYFRPQVFDRQQPGAVCPLRDANYQLMRNFLFAAASAQRTGRLFFGVIVICPDCTSTVVREQVSGFKANILLPEFADRVQFITYETYIDALRGRGTDAGELADFLQARIQAVAAV